MMLVAPIEGEENYRKLLQKGFGLEKQKVKLENEITKLSSSLNNVKNDIKVNNTNTKNQANLIIKDAMASYTKFIERIKKEETDKK